VRIGEPIDTAGMSTGDRDRLIEIVRERIAALVAESTGVGTADGGAAGGGDGIGGDVRVGVEVALAPGHAREVVEVRGFVHAQELFVLRIACRDRDELDLCATECGPHGLEALGAFGVMTAGAMTIEDGVVDERYGEGVGGHEEVNPVECAERKGRCRH